MIIAVILIAFIYVVVRFIAPHKPSRQKSDVYECGEETEGETWIRFNIRFYVIALIFIIFDVEIIFLFPWAVVFREIGFIAYAEMAIFLLILIVGLIYAIAKGDVQWDKPEPVIPKLERQLFSAKPDINKKDNQY